MNTFAKKHFLLFISLVFIVQTQLWAQKEKLPKFGKVSKADFAITGIEGDENPDAVIIFDLGYSRFNQTPETGFELVFERKTRIKINNKAGFDYAEVNIPVYASGRGYERVKGVKAITWNLEGGKPVKTELGRKEVFEEKKNENWSIKKFVLPNVKEGSIIEFRYTVVSPYMFNLKDWTFQHKIPTKYSEYKIDMTPYFDYVHIKQGIAQFDVYEDYQNQAGLPERLVQTSMYNKYFKYGLKNIPAFKDESFIATINDHLMKIDFQLSTVYSPANGQRQVLTSWETLDSDLMSHSKFLLFVDNAQSNAKRILKDANIMEKSEVERFTYLMNYMKSNYDWNGRHGIYSSKPPGEFGSSKSGNVASMNLFLIALFRQAGLASLPVILSTRQHGKVWLAYPVVDKFNYVVAYVRVDGKWILADVTNPQCANDQIPIKCLNGQARIIGREAKHKWIDLSQAAQASKLQENISIQLNESKDSALVDFQIKTTAYDALNLREAYQNNAKELAESWEEDGLEIRGEVKTEHYNKIDENYMISFKAAYPIEKIEDQLFIPPFFKEVFEENPLKQAERRYPVDMAYKRVRLYQSEIMIPEGYKASSLPEDFMVNDDLMTIQYKVQASESKIKLMGMYQFKKAVYEPEDYAQLKAHFEHLVKYLNEKVGLGR